MTHSSNLLGGDDSTIYTFLNVLSYNNSNAILVNERIISKLRAGLPDFFFVQQNITGKIYQNDHKIKPNGHKMYEMAVK
jgi:hypothetical protein